MKSYHMSLRTKVVLSLTFLMVSAMLLIGVVMLKVSQHDLIQAKVEQAMLLKVSLENILNEGLSSKSDNLLVKQGSTQVARLETAISEIVGIWKITVTDQEARVVHASGGRNHVPGQRLVTMERVTRLGEGNITFTPSRTLLSWLPPENMILDAPLFRRASCANS